MRGVANFKAIHLGGWIIIGLIVALQQPWELATDTKLDLLVNPAGFLGGALEAYSLNFPLGQLQNQAYGYLFPQGAFFLLTDFLPDIIAQRLWWIIVLGTGFSGFLHLLNSQRIGTPTFQVLAALLFAFSPRTLSTLTTISSETWPIMLAPWVLAAVLRTRLNLRALAASILPVALMGAVNATATLIACLPAGIALVYRIVVEPSRRKATRFLGAWLIGCALVSLWWIGPLVVLGRFAPPFTEFIESGYVTTRWLNLIEILRGTTSWAPFADSERTAGTLLVSEPAFILATAAVAALGIAGLTRRGLAHRGVWLVLLFSGVALLGAAHGPLGSWWIGLLDGPLAAFRNLHKADLLVRIPLLIGVAQLGSHLHLPTRWAEFSQPTLRQAAALVIVVIALAQLAPALSLRMMPRGTWDEIPKYWYEAAEFLNEHASQTRTLITPSASFARQEWGWTRDEPAQPLLEVPWVVRDAVPLVDPEAIRGLDGLNAVLENYPEKAGEALAQFGIGAVLVRHDLDEKAVSHGQVPDVAALAGGLQVHSFGDVDVIIFDSDTSAQVITPSVRVAGGGEVLPLLDSLVGRAPRQLVEADADIVTDTPMAISRNYGGVSDNVSAPLASAAEGADVRNRLPDYLSVGPRSVAKDLGGDITASSSASQATSFGGADPARGVGAAVDKQPDTAWWPAPGVGAGEWIELHGDFGEHPTLSLSATKHTEVIISNGEKAYSRVKIGRSPKEFTVPGAATGTVRVTLTERVGIRSISLDSADIERVVRVPDSSLEVKMFFFQQLMVDTKVMLREFTAPRNMDVLLAAEEPVEIDGQRYLPGDRLHLSEGTHLLRSQTRWLSLTEPGFDPLAADGGALYAPELSANAGLEATWEGQTLTPVMVGSGMQGFVLPEGFSPGPSGETPEITVFFAGEKLYSTSLLAGGLLLAVVLTGCVVVCVRWREDEDEMVASSDWAPHPGWGVMVYGVAAVALVSGIAGLIAAAVAVGIRRWTLIPSWVLGGGLIFIAGAWLARAPWPSALYAGDQPVVQWVCAAGLGCLLPLLNQQATLRAWRRRRPGRETPVASGLTGPREPR